MIENYNSNNIFIKLNKELKKSKLYKEISKSKEIKSITSELIMESINENNITEDFENNYIIISCNIYKSNSIYFYSYIIFKLKIFK